MSKSINLIAGIFVAVSLFSSTANIVSAAPILKLHAEGHDVRLLQQLLQKHNYTVNVTGIFDETTQTAIKAFQTDNHLPATGIVDHQTWWSLNGTSPSAGVPAVTSAPRPTSPLVAGIPVRKPTTGRPDKNSQIPQSEESAIATIRNQQVTETAPFLPGNKAAAIISTAKKYIGVPYIYGGATPKGFDCSGYLQYVFKQNNFIIPRTADAQYEIGRKLPVNQLQAGDLVFFSTDTKEVSHCGIYLGDGQFIHASTSKGVRIDRLDNTYWQKYFIGGKHIVK
ncbi:NlpC/P60 family protein [Pectinatus frisingensis]|jgi:cell wall-associated NlpC family hydrolase|uniref:C40 family peptidase n=1 Tax=Pectinatus frisingensis TaxID=865 RepID=UPI0018C52556|nr:NlpC/P60 family protein [Pectinatus frisingensis]